MKFLHIILPSKRMMNTFVKMIRENFDTEEHAFLFLNRCVTDEDRQLFKYGNMLEIPKSRNRLKQVWDLYHILRQYDCIIWHGLIYDWKKAIAIFLLQKQLKKSIWVIRGIDLYNYKLRGETIKNKILNYINYRIRKMVPRVVTIFPTDEIEYHKQFGYDSICYQAFYPIGQESFDEMNQMMNGKSRNDGTVWILNGNNAYTFNRHIEVLQDLLKFKDKPIRIIVPLSYGNDWVNSRKNYKQEIYKFLRENYNGKYDVLFQLMPIEQYNELLANIDVAIINSNRQNALGNILRLLYIGCKVYLAEDNLACKYFHKMGLPVYAVNDIINEDFNAFTTKNYSIDTVKWIRANFHPESNVLQWKKIFDDIAKTDTGIYSLMQMEQTAKDVINQVDNKYKQYQKKNYIYLRRFKSPGRTFKNHKDLIIVGHNDTCISLVNNVYQNRARKPEKYLFKGFLGEQDDIDFPIEYLGNYDTYEFTKHDICLCGLDIPYKRRSVIQFLERHGAYFTEYVETDSRIGIETVVGENNIIVDSSIIGNHCVIGDFVLLQGGKIGDHVRIGDYSVIRQNVIVKENSIIKGNVVIKPNVIIGKNCIINDGVIIEAGSIIADDSIITRKGEAKNVY